QGYPVTFSVGGEQFVAVPTGYNGGSPEQKPTTMLRGEVNRPTFGHGVYVFGLPRASPELSVPVRSTAPADKERYLAHLSPMPFSEATQPNMIGKGSGSATLQGDTLLIDGAFGGLASAATKAHLSLSKVAGMPGTPLFDLTVSNDIVGKLAGQVKLNADQ